jgi:uncharacterized protein (TIGR02594 family)
LSAPEWLVVAVGEIGVTEVSGAGSNQRILDYHHETSLGASDDAVSWCSSFVNWCMQRAGIAGSHSAAARSWLKWGKSLTAPVLGAVVVLSRGSNPAQGHVGLYLNHTGDRTSVYLLNGNVGDRVCVSAFPVTRILGYRWPAP